uniref:Integrase core domain containing protein n=1 Tax=Solanum tuberosum TaxID=4113 RepID=M1DWA3_SOLTU
MDTTWQEGTRWLKRQRNEGLKITEPSWQVADGPGDRLLFQCSEPEGKGQNGDEMEQSLERVNPSPSPTHSARESEWAKEEVVLNTATRWSREPELIRDMVRTNPDWPPQKKVRGITINEGGANPGKRRRQELPPGDKGKRKKHTSKRVVVHTRTELSEPEDEQHLISRRDEIRARSQTTSTKVPSDAIPTATDSVPAQAPPMTPMPPVSTQAPKEIKRL